MISYHTFVTLFLIRHVAMDAWIKYRLSTIPKLFLIFFIFCLPFKSSMAIVQDETVTYRVGVSYINSYPLLSFANVDDKGYGWAVLEAFAKANNVAFEYIGMPITRLQPSLDNGGLDFIFPDHPKWSNFRTARQPNIYSGPIISTISATFVLSTNKNKQLEDLKSVAIPFGYTSYTWTQPIEKYGIKTVPVGDLRAALESVVNKRTDSADVEYNIGKHLIDKYPHLQKLDINKNYPNAEVNYHLSTIRHADIAKRITAFIDANPSLISELKQKYNIKEHSEVY